jgi:U4/U6 small nuclear ribonucleoprotein PRP31
MASLADELLNDFEGSGSEDEGKLVANFLDDSSEPHHQDSFGEPRGSMELDGDEEELDDENDGIDADAGRIAELAVSAGDEVKAKIEKMQLGAVSDVRSVARLMKALQPILDVSCPFPLYYKCQATVIFVFTLDVVDK